MATDRPTAIRPTHLQRHAIIYHRRAVVQQQIAHLPSSFPPPAHLRGIAISWGWPAEMVSMIEDAGAGTRNNPRLGFKAMVEMIGRGHVGLVLVSDVARITRDVQEYRRFLNVCRKHDTLLVAEDAHWNVEAVAGSVQSCPRSPEHLLREGARGVIRGWIDTLLAARLKKGDRINPQ